MSLLAQVTIINEKFFPKDIIWDNKWIKVLNLLTSKLNRLKNGVVINQLTNIYPNDKVTDPLATASNGRHIISQNSNNISIAAPI